MTVTVPVMPRQIVLPQRDYPISPRENLMLALNHQKPYWMPDFYGSSQGVRSKLYREKCPTLDADGVDWFGARYKYVPAQGGTTPQPGLFESIDEWEDKVRFPNFDDRAQFDWEADAAGFKRDPDKALYMRFSNGVFERLHMSEGFEQALIDLISEPEACKAYFERMVDYKIDLFNHFRDVYPLDYLVYADDYGTQNGPFFSTELFEKVMLEADIRLVKAVQARGTKFVLHSCGKIDAFLPYFIEDMGVDGLEIQKLNDIAADLGAYGDRVLISIKPDDQVVYDDQVTDERLTRHIRQLVDAYGAASNPGPGIALRLRCGTEHGLYLMEDELYRYSTERYTTFH